MINNECVVQRLPKEGLVATGKLLQAVLAACELANIKSQLLLYVLRFGAGADHILGIVRYLSA